MIRPAIFHPKAREDVRTFPEEVKKAFGKALHDLQKGIRLQFPLSRPMPEIRTGTEEI